MSEFQPSGIDHSKLLKCPVMICQIPNSVVSESDRRCMYADHTNPDTENAAVIDMNYSDFLESHNYLRDKCPFGDQIYSSRKNSNT